MGTAIGERLKVLETLSVPTNSGNSLLLGEENSRGDLEVRYLLE